MDVDRGTNPLCRALIKYPSKRFRKVVRKKSPKSPTSRHLPISTGAATNLKIKTTKLGLTARWKTLEAPSTLASSTKTTYLMLLAWIELFLTKGKKWKKWCNSWIQVQTEASFSLTSNPTNRLWTTRLKKAESSCRALHPARKYLKLKSKRRTVGVRERQTTFLRSNLITNKARWAAILLIRNPAKVAKHRQKKEKFTKESNPTRGRTTTEARDRTMAIVRTTMVGVRGARTLSKLNISTNHIRLKITAKSSL